MAQWYKVMEIANPDGSSKGKFRMVVSNTSGTRIHGLCEHEHDTREEADACPDIQEEMERAFPKKPAGTKPSGQLTTEAHDESRVMAEQIVEAEMPRYLLDYYSGGVKLSATVHALKVLGVRACSVRDEATLAMEKPFAPIVVSGRWMEQNDPSAGGYYVVAADCTAEFLSAEHFETYYTKEVE